ncbi:MAG: hypothetical protein Q9168_000692 [Polycauliona sp. 1 TL-2023]
MSSLSAGSPRDEGIIPEPPGDPAHEQSEPPMSKNKRKKLLRDQKWEEGRERRKELRKVKAKGKKEKKRAAQTNNNNGPPLDSTHEKRSASAEPAAPAAKKPKILKPVQLPVSIVIDCNFDHLMRDNERTSLASQLTRSYSENHKAPFKSHLFVSSFGGLLKQRFDTILAGHHLSWKGVKFLEGDFEAAATEAVNLMKTNRGGRLAGAFQESEVEQDAEATSPLGEVVYLTSDSPETLTELKPYSTYIIGGIVDKNRHKGICYKRAVDRGFRTAKLPIGDYMKMSSRFVLATNHVVEIMLKWLEMGDWGKALMEVVPQRKGGVLKDGMTVLDKDPEATTRAQEAGSEDENDQDANNQIEEDREEENREEEYREQEDPEEQDPEEKDPEESTVRGKYVDVSNVDDVATDAPEHSKEDRP